MQHLQRDVAAVLDVVGEVDSRHAAGAQLPADAIAVGKDLGESSDGSAHRLRQWEEMVKLALASRNVHTLGRPESTFLVMDLIFGFRIDDPAAFIPWDITQAQLRECLGE